MYLLFPTSVLSAILEAGVELRLINTTASDSSRPLKIFPPPLIESDARRSTILVCRVDVHNQTCAEVLKFLTAQAVYKRW